MFGDEAITYALLLCIYYVLDIMIMRLYSLFSFYLREIFLNTIEYVCICGVVICCELMIYFLVVGVVVGCMFYFSA